MQKKQTKCYECGTRITVWLTCECAACVKGLDYQRCTSCSRLSRRSVVKLFNDHLHPGEEEFENEHDLTFRYRFNRPMRHQEATVDYPGQKWWFVRNPLKRERR